MRAQVKHAGGVSVDGCLSHRATEDLLATSIEGWIPAGVRDARLRSDRAGKSDPPGFGDHHGHRLAKGMTFHCPGMHDCKMAVIIWAVGWRWQHVVVAGIGFFGAAAFTQGAVANAAPPPPIRVHVLLSSHQVVAGQIIKGSVVLTNTTTKPIIVNTCAINGWVAVGLSGRVDSYPFGHTEVGCNPSVKIKPGVNRFRVSVITAYAVCTAPSPSGSSHPTSLSPNCVLSKGKVVAPPLPAGRYRTKVDIVGLDGLTRAAKSVTVSLTPPASPPKLPPCAETTTSAPSLVTVPNVVGTRSSIAAYALSKACLNAGYASPVGSTVVSQAPVAGSKVAEYSTVTLTTK